MDKPKLKFQLHVLGNMIKISGLFRSSHERLFRELRKEVIFRVIIMYAGEVCSAAPRYLDELHLGERGK